MKLICATIRPFFLADVQHALGEFGRMASITEVKTYDPRPASVRAYRGGEYPVELVPRIRIEIIVPATQVERAIEIIRKTAMTGHVGDGNIVVMTVDRLVGIRTGELVVDEPGS